MCLDFRNIPCNSAIQVMNCSPMQVMGLTKLGVGIAASDETSIDTAVLTFKGYTKEVKGVVSQYNTHSVRPISAYS